MTFIVLLTALILDRLYDYHKVYRDFNWFNQWQTWLKRKIFNQFEATQVGAWIFYAVSLLVPLWMVNIIVSFLFDFNSLISALVSVGVLLISLGPIDFENSIDDYLIAKASADEEQAKHYANVLIYDNNEALEETEVVQVTRSILYCSVEHFFATLFWFVIVGPVAAMFYRIILQNYLNNRDDSIAKLLLACAIYIPSYLVFLSFALVGSFEQTIKKFQEMSPYSNDLLSKCRQLAAASGCASLSMNTPDNDSHHDETYLVENARAIILRVLVIWVSVVLIVTFSQLST
jgi:AmpE protein